MVMFTRTMNMEDNQGNNYRVHSTYPETVDASVDDIVDIAGHNDQIVLQFAQHLGSSLPAKDGEATSESANFEMIIPCRLHMSRVAFMTITKKMVSMADQINSEMQKPAIAQTDE